MQTVTLKIDDNISEKFLWLLKHFQSDEIKILEQTEYIDDDTYLRSIEGMRESIQKARKEPLEKGVSLEDLDW